MDDYLTVEEVANLYAVSQRTVRNWINSGKIHAKRVGGRIIRIDAQSLDFLCEPVQYQGYTARTRTRY
jgi:excisionase family DNA binding protein